MTSLPPKKYQHALQINTTFELDIDINDCYRCCKSLKTGESEGIMEAAMDGDSSALRGKRKEQIVRLKALKSEEAAALDVCKKVSER